MSIDWLMIFGSLTKDISQFSDVQLSDNYEIDIKQYGTRQFKKVVEFNDRASGEKFATLCFLPYSVKNAETPNGIFDENDATLQLSNFFCYQLDGVSQFNKFQQLIGFQFKSITRLDLCIDQEHFDNGLSGKTLLDGYMSGKYVKMGAQKFTAYGRDNNTKVYECVSFGGGNSRVTSKIYNKTQEMKDKGMKHYIWKKWEQTGFKPSDTTIWRVEVSIKSDGMNVLDKETGEMMKIDYGQLDDVNYFMLMLMYYLNYYVRMRIAGTATRKERLKPLQLWKWESQNENITPYQFKGLKETNRSHKNALNRLTELAKHPEVSEADKLTLLQTIIVMSLLMSNLKTKSIERLREYTEEYVIETAQQQWLREVLTKVKIE